MVQAYPCLMLRRDLTKGPYGTGFLSLLDCQEQQAHILADEDLVINFDQDNILGEGLRSTMVNNFSKDLLTASSHPALRLWQSPGRARRVSRLENLDGLVSKKNTGKRHGSHPQRFGVFG